MNAIEMTAKLYERRNAAKTLLGEHYQRDMKLMAAAITLRAEQEKRTPLAAAISMSKEKSDGYSSIVILAAAIEMVESSEPAKAPR